MVYKFTAYFVNKYAATDVIRMVEFGDRVYQQTVFKWVVYLFLYLYEAEIVQTQE